MISSNTSPVPASPNVVSNVPVVSYLAKAKLAGVAPKVSKLPPNTILLSG